MNLIILKNIFILITIFNLKRASGAGLVEVFRWKQMDFQNRGYAGSRADVHGAVSADKPLIRIKDKIYFPDDVRNLRYKRTSEVITSRDNPVITSARWGSLPSKADHDTTNRTSYIPYNNVPMGATHFSGRLFVTMPRRRIGIPSTLNYIDLTKDGNNPSPKLYAYPNFDTNYLSPKLEPNPNRIVSVYRTTVDACNRLWFIDTGMLEYPNNRTQLQRPSIWIIDLATNKRIHRFTLQESVVETGNGLASITIDVSPENCGNAFAYIPDLVYNVLYVYSLKNDHIWTFSHNYFNFDPLGGDLSIGGQSFRWNDGIFSVSLGPRMPTGYRNVFFHAMASNNEFVVSSQVLQNEANAGRSDHGQDFQLLGSRGVGRQSTMHDYDPLTGVLFYAEIQRNGVGCWNTNKPFNEANHGTVAQDAVRMIYPSDLTIDQEGTMWVMTNSMPIFIYSTLDTDVFNFRVWKQSVHEAIKGTVCE